VRVCGLYRFSLLLRSSSLGRLGLLLDHGRLLAGLVHRRCVDYVLQVFRNVRLSMVAQLLDDLEAVKESSIVFDIRLPLHDANSVVYKKGVA